MSLNWTIMNCPLADQKTWVTGLSVSSEAASGSLAVADKIAGYNASLL